MQDLTLYTERLLEERSSRPRHLLTSSHFTNEDYDRLHILYHTRVVSRSEVDKAIEIACTSQKPLRNDILRALMTVPYNRSKEARVVAAPLWLKICRYRERVRDVVLVIGVVVVVLVMVVLVVLVVGVVVVVVVVVLLVVSLLV